jgi:hypothetical protein
MRRSVLTRDRPTRLDLLPMPSGESVRDHVFWRESSTFANLVNAFAQSAKEGGVIHAQFLAIHEQKRHEQNSCAAVIYSCRNPLVGQNLETFTVRHPLPSSSGQGSPAVARSGRQDNLGGVSYSRP